MIVAAGIRTRYDWQPDLRFMVRLDIYSYSTENYSPDILTSQSFSVDDPEALVNEAIHAFVLDYVTTEWGMVIDPAVDTIVIINPYEKAPPPLALNTDKLLAYWKLDEDTSAVSGLLDSHASFDLTNNGGVTFEAGQVDRAARFAAASSQSLSHPYAADLNPTDALTFSCWVKLWFGIQGIAGTWTYNTNKGWALTMDVDGSFAVYVAADAGDTGNNYGTTTNQWGDNLWHHVVVHIDTAGATDADRLTIAVDGAPETLIFTGTIPAAIIDGGGPFTIGDWPGQGFADGLIDECEYRDGAGDLIANWKFDGTVRADSVGSNHLTEVGTVTREATPDGSFAAVFDQVGPGYLQIDDSPDLVSGDFDFTVTLMAKYDPTDLGGVDACLFSSRDVVGGFTAFGLWRAVGGEITILTDTGTEQGNFPTGIFLDPNGYGGFWSFLRFWYDSTANTYNLQIDAQPAKSMAGDPLVSGSTRFEVGSNNGANVFSGAMRRVAYWKRILTDEEWAIIYNDGAGQDYPFEEVNLPITLVRNASYCRMDVDHAISSSTKTVIPRMAFVLEPYTNYSIELTLYTTSNDEAVGVQFKLAGVSGDEPNLNAACLILEGPGSPTTVLWIDGGGFPPFLFEPIVSQGNVPATVKITGTLEVGDTGGTLELWHGSSDATLTTVLRGSWGMLARH